MMVTFGAIDQPDLVALLDLVEVVLGDFLHGRARGEHEEGEGKDKDIPDHRRIYYTYRY